MKLFIRNIPWDATEESFRKWLTDVQGYEVGEVKIILSPENGRSRGFGFVTFSTEAAGFEALRDLNEAEFMDRPLHAEEAIERESRQTRKRNGGSRGRRARRAAGESTETVEGRFFDNLPDVWGD